MARAVEPRPRRLAAGFAVYAAVVTAAAYWYSPQLAPYVDPGATFWISTAYVVLGAVAVVGISAAAVLRARRLEDRTDQLEALRRRVRELENPGGRVKPVTDSGSAETEVEALLDGFSQMTGPSAVDEVLKEETWEMGRLRKARDAVGTAALGPAVAAIALMGMFAPLLPASDGMLFANLTMSAFLGVAGLGFLIGIPIYAAAAFRQIRVHT